MEPSRIRANAAQAPGATIVPRSTKTPDVPRDEATHRRMVAAGSPTRAPDLRIGCSGWQYKHWRGNFYPAELPQSRWFAHYALTFDTVEINNSFYRLPDGETF